ncbi:MAG: hypothetical protein JNL12_20975 [Planctomycetes bacterium]|nr:hypothetical protein [Planctomycetota bacterium]
MRPSTSSRRPRSCVRAVVVLLWLAASGCTFLADEFVWLDRAAAEAPGDRLPDGAASRP